MKIFIQNYIMDDSKIEYDKKIFNDIIYTPFGLLMYKNKKWRKQNTVKDKYYLVQHNEYEMLVEDNMYEYNEIYTHIPYEHVNVTETYETYNIDYNLSLIKHSYLDQTSFYFETNQIEEELINKLVSFLSNK